MKGATQYRETGTIHTILPLIYHDTHSQKERKKPRTGQKLYNRQEYPHNCAINPPVVFWSNLTD